MKLILKHCQRSVERVRKNYLSMVSIIITVHTKMIHFAFQKLISMSYDVLT